MDGLIAFVATACVPPCCVAPVSVIFIVAHLHREIYSFRHKCDITTCLRTNLLDSGIGRYFRNNLRDEPIHISVSMNASGKAWNPAG